MAAAQVQTYLNQQVTSFRAAVQRLREISFLKIGEGNAEATIANNLPQVRSEISAIVSAHVDAFPAIAALWRVATPIPDLTAHPHPGVFAPSAQEQRNIDLWDKTHDRELLEREMHRLLVDALYTLARPTYHHLMEIDQPAVGGVIEKGINGQDLSTAWLLLQDTVGNPRSANLNVLENRMKSERQPTGLPMVEWLALFLQKLAKLRLLGRTYEGRPCEAVDYFIATIVAPTYGEFIRTFLAEYYDDATRTMPNLTAWVNQRAWTYEQGIGGARRGGLGAIDSTDEDVDTDLAAVAPAAAGRKPALKPAATVAGNLPVTTTIDFSLYNKKTLKDMGLKLVALDSKPKKPENKARAPAAPTMAYCWTHGRFELGHRGYHHGHECQNPKTGHREEATETNRMGGSNKLYKA